MASSVKFVVFAALTLLLNMHWASCQYYSGYGPYGYPPMCRGNDNDNGLETILPILLLAMMGRGGGCGGGCGGGFCGNGGGCGCGGCGCGGCGCGGCGCGGCGCCGGGCGCGRC